MRVSAVIGVTLLVATGCLGGAALAECARTTPLSQPEDQLSFDVPVTDKAAPEWAVYDDESEVD